jgi:hypothetical protein
MDVGVPGTSTTPPPVNSVIYTNGTAGPWSFPVPLNVSFVQVEGWGAGGPGALRTVNPDGEKSGFGGGGGAYFKKHVAVTGGTTLLSGVIGAPGNPIGPSAGGATTLASPACAANGGNPAAGAVTEGTGGTASGGDINTTGNNGGLTNTWDGGSGANGGGDQTIVGAGGTIPGGGSAGGTEGFVSSGANGQIKITSVAS